MVLKNQNIATVLVQESIALNSNVNIKAVQTMVTDSALSWDMIDDQHREFVMKRLRIIEDLDEDQCNALYRKIDDMAFIVVGRKMAEWLRDIKSTLDGKWIQKRMSSLYSLRTTYSVLLDSASKL